MLTWCCARPAAAVSYTLPDPGAAAAAPAPSTPPAPPSCLRCCCRVPCWVLHDAAGAAGRHDASDDAGRPRHDAHDAAAAAAAPPRRRRGQGGLTRCCPATGLVSAAPAAAAAARAWSGCWRASGGAGGQEGVGPACNTRSPEHLPRQRGTRVVVGNGRQAGYATLTPAWQECHALARVSCPPNSTPSGVAESRRNPLRLRERVHIKI